MSNRDKYGKLFVYNRYVEVVDHPIAYERITRKKIFESMYAYYMDEDHLEQFLTPACVALLKEILEQGSIEYSNLDAIDYLTRYFIIDLSDKKITIVDELVDFIRNHIYEYDIEAMKERERKYYIYLGLLRVYGVINLITFDSLLHLYSEVFEIDLGNKDEFIQNRMIRQHFVLTHDDEFDYLVYEPLEEEWERIVEIQNAHEQSPKIMDIEDLYVIGKEAINTNNPKLAKYLQYFNETVEFTNIKRFMDAVVVSINNEEDVQYKIEKLINELWDVSMLDNADKLLKFVEIMKELPLAIYYGNSIEDLKKFLEHKKEVETKITHSKQKNAHLSSKEASHFYSLYMGLLQYVNQKYQICTHVDFANTDRLDPNDQVLVREKLFEDLSIIDEYIEKNPYRLKRVDLRAVSKFKESKYIQCFIVKYEEDMTLIIDNNEMVYGIVGGVSNLDEIIPSNELPAPSKMVLMPYKNKIVYDGVIEGVALKIGANMHKRLLDTCEQSPIYTTLPIQAKLN